MAFDSINPKKKDIPTPEHHDAIPVRLAKGLVKGMHYIDPRHYKKLFEHDEDEEKNFYKSFFAHQFILRDHLAIDRTMLANESTLLAYIRTGLAISAAGGTLIHFATNSSSRILGIVLIAAGVIGFIIGTTRYEKRKKSINAIRNSKEHDEAVKHRQQMNGVE